MFRRASHVTYIRIYWKHAQKRNFLKWLMQVGKPWRFATRKTAVQGEVEFSDCLVMASALHENSIIHLHWILCGFNWSICRTIFFQSSVNQQKRYMNKINSLQSSRSPTANTFINMIVCSENLTDRLEANVVQGCIHRHACQSQQKIITTRLAPIHNAPNAVEIQVRFQAKNWTMIHQYYIHLTWSSTSSWHNLAHKHRALKSLPIPTLDCTSCRPWPS